MKIERVTELSGNLLLVEKERPEKIVGTILTDQKMSVGTAESCTGGVIAGRFTSIPGSSEYFKGGIVSYANEVKIDLLKVSPEIIAKHGAVSEETAIEMVKGAMKALKTDCAVASTGIAGPTGGTATKPVGTIWLAAGIKNHIMTFKQERNEGREKNLLKAVDNALLLLLKLLK